MKNNCIKSHKGFTLVEMIVAITISVIIMGGVLTFLTRLQNDITLLRQSTQVYTNLTDFMGMMRNFEKLYSSGTVIVGWTGTYNVWLFTRPDQTSWVLIWIVEAGSGDIFTLDPIANKNTYGKKVIAYQKLNAWQISSILASTGSVYNTVFSDEWLYKDLTVTDFFITPYNSGSLFEYRLNIETPFYVNLLGQSRDSIAPKVTTFSFTLDF